MLLLLIQLYLIFHECSLGLDMFIFSGATKDEVFVLIRASLERLRNFADDIDFQMLLDEKVLESYALKGDVEAKIGPIDMYVLRVHMCLLC